MTETKWSKVEGMVIGPDLEPMKLAEYLKTNSVLAQIEWYDATPQLVGIRVATDGDAVATLSASADKAEPGHSLGDLANFLANEFSAEVMLGSSHVDMIAGDRGALVNPMEPAESDEPIRIVEIGHTPSSAVPLLAAFEGVDIAEIDLPGGKRLLAAQLPPHRVGWYFGDTPLVALTFSGDEFQSYLMRDDDPEGMVSYNWGMNELVVAGKQGWGDSAGQIAHDLVGSRQDIEAIHNAVPGVDLQGAFDASLARGPQAVRKFVKSLGLQDDIADFLLGIRTIDELHGARLHHSRGISNAIGRSVDMMIDERQGESQFWESYSNMVRKHSWLVPVLSSVEASLGATLIAISRKRTGQKKSTLASIGTTVGALMIVDSVAEMALAKYVTWRADRREGRNSSIGLTE